MAGNIQWFRWHHGSVGDPKFGRVAVKAKVSLPVVIAVWACILERASAADDRGSYAGIDWGDIDYLLRLDDGQAHAVAMAMHDLVLLDKTTGDVLNWAKRQPRREREDDDSAERVQRHREKKRQETTGQPSVTHVTPSNANETNVTPREEKRRGEERREEVPTHTSSDSTDTATQAGAVCVCLRAIGISGVQPHNPNLLELLGKGATVGSFEGAAQSAKESGKPSFAYVLGIVKQQMREAAQIATASLAPAGQGPPNKQEALENRNRQIARDWAEQRQAGAEA